MHLYKNPHFAHAYAFHVALTTNCDYFLKEH